MDNISVSTIIDGLSTGTLYGLIALALVLVLRSTSIVNFAQGEMAMFTTFITWSLMRAMPAWPAVLIALAIACALGALLEAVFVRRVEKGPALSPVLLTLGLFLVFNSVVLWRYGSMPKPFPSPFGDGSVRVGDVRIANQTVGNLGVALAVVLLLYVLFRFTTLGLALRATAQDRLAAQLMGIRVGWMLSLSWALAAVLGTVAGLLLAPSLMLRPSMMQSALSFAFAAAALGGLNSPLGAVVGGMLVGVVESLAGHWSLVGADLQPVVAVILLIAVLTVRPAGIFGKRVVQRV